MKTVTSTLLSSLLMASALFTHSAFAADTNTSVEQQLVSTISTGIKQQANEMYYGAKAEILASVQQQLHQLAAATKASSDVAVNLIAGDTAAGTATRVSTDVIVAQDNH
ncbi:hypothetical protein L9G74_14085 [Shewanella sp. C32]|uniref:Uncharacterized protein n=1 Tax=Shewanella electrica TaxID=515560 RepID=A0ABT2FML1_9GAMM|nr:hypothetical protein [Shewanella electrica]MCH1926056.1 hypothetical protein [Shewanella electrica]MCS4557575.1 hypothetical protein [Shewanella electrica]